MTFPRKIGLLLLLVAGLSFTGHLAGLTLPSLRWFYSFHAEPGSFEPGNWREKQGAIIGHAACGLMAVVGVLLLATGGRFRWNPLTLRKFSRFRSIGRGWVSFRLLVLVFLLLLLDQVLVGKKALAVHYNGNWSFPAFQAYQFKDRDFGGEGEQDADYRKLAEYFQQESRGNRVIMPPVPWDPTFDSDDLLIRDLVENEGKLYRAGSNVPYNGEATRYSLEHPEIKARSARFRKGVEDGISSIFAADGQLAGLQIWKEGALVESRLPEGVVEVPAGPWKELIYSPAPPSWEKRHYLGTDSKGWDIAAQMFGGAQVVFKAAALYLLVTYSIGIILGALMGYFGGLFDLILQRLIEILSNIPFLLLVMIIAAGLGRERVNLVIIMLTFCIFSWIYVATYLRTSTFREKARDYVAAARVQGAGTARVIFRHILPNSISTIVTLLPFSVAGITSSLTALDFLGFGLPDRYASWGRVLDDGTSNLSSVWIVSSVFTTMVGMLLLITFIGEAIREAFDPKKFTTYQ